MATPQCLIEKTLQSLFKDLGLDPTLGLLKISDRPDLCDYQCNGALSGAKILGQNPRTLAETIVQKAKAHFPDLKIDVGGPGFLNLTLSNASLCESFNKYDAPSFPIQKQKIIVDYCGPNVAKPMHVGHLRSTIIGETLKRLFQFVGHEVIGDIHMGDWGTQMGMIIHELSLERPDLPYFDSSFSGPYPKESPVTLEDLQKIYPLISAKCKEDPMIAEQARLATVELQQGRPGYRALWQHFVQISIDDMREQLQKLNVDFDQWFGESRYQEKIPPLLAGLESKRIAHESEGALIMDVADSKDKNPMPPLVLRKTDGGFLYATTDLATIEERVTLFNADRIVYVVDGRQALHFEQVFRGAKKCGFQAIYDFIGFGTMNGTDGKPFKTRAGGVMRLGDLIQMLIQEAKDRLEEAGLGQDLSPEKLEEIARKIGMSALKFADLQHDPVQNYQFDLQKFMRFEGKTGPYILYAGVRIQSMLQKTKEMGIQGGPIGPDLLPEERDLVLALTRFEDFIMRAYEKLSPNILCDYLFELAQKFSRFYQAAHILSEKDSRIQSSRVTIAEKTLEALRSITYLLNIDIPEQM